MEGITLECIQKASEVLYSNPDIVKTPLVCHFQDRFPALDKSVDLYLKLENMQITGSFKIRGVINQMNHLPPAVKTESKLPVTLSAGNYGKAFAYCLKKQGLSGIVVLPDSAPDDRVKIIESYGVQAEKVLAHKIQERVDEYVEKGYFLLHPHEDANLIAAYGSIGMEILSVVPDPDVVVVCCGGGALVAGVAAAIKLSPGGSKCRVYAVEPTGAPTMYESFKAGHAVKMPTARSIATGLMPPFAGKLPYELCKKYVEDVILVSDEEMVNCVRTLYYAGLVVEPAGSAAMTSLLTSRIPNISQKKVVVVISGGNISPQELAKLIS
ncbi:hypothetical protein CHS0354_026178 [Potamilus streckersoni]|uniref:L-serine ammonia-lyase n=1 Tax=Potamilus streckersoni TaxID=2493646 RepID=A0AAE0SBA5_9BIVA|nr:hypothetical protein CHS0354_026178 [Potamilus streckersoni]